ncbi:MAG: glutamine synthetase family protein [Porcipelethomonas sp.]
MIYDKNEILQYIDENDVKFVKLTFCDINGKLKNISVLSSELEAVFEHGIKITAKKITGFGAADGRDLFLFPDCSTMTPLPWRPQQGKVIRMFCNIKYSDGTPFEGDGRYFLKKAVKTAMDKGFCFRFGTSCEFTLFRLDEKGNPTKTPHDYGGYCDAAPDDMGENIRREICLTLEQMNIRPIASHHESGYGQHEIDFSSSSALKAADTFLSFKSAVKSVTQRNNAYASFMPKPDAGNYGNGMHISMNIMKENQLFDETDNNHGRITPEVESAAAGVMKYIRDFSIFTNTNVNSYSRLGMFAAPRFITWSHKDISQVVRITDGELPVILRAPDCACNPYFVFGLIIYAAVYGAENKLSLPDEVCEDIVSADSLETLPKNLGEAVSLAENSQFLREYVPESILDFIIQDRQNEWESYVKAADKNIFEEQKYFYNV